MKFAICGAGAISEQFLTEYWNKLEISIIFDNNREGRFYKWNIEKPCYMKNIFIIVTSQHYYEIRNQLIGLGYSEFADFVPYQIFNRKMAVAYGNCHMRAIKEYLERDKELAGDYGFYPFPMIQEMCLLPNHELVLSHCELFIHQSIRKENKYGEIYASQSMILHLPGKCRVISIPNLYGMPECFFPQQKHNVDAKDIRGLAREDVKVAEWINEGKTKEEIKTLITGGGVYQRQEILDLWDNFQNKLYAREKEWDVKISDYIMKNYKTQKLFYERLHISHALVKEIASRTLQYMGYRGVIPYELPLSLDYREMFIYQDVMEALDLQFDQRYIRLSQKTYPYDKCQMDIDAYIYLMCNWIRRKQYLILP